MRPLDELSEAELLTLVDEVDREEFAKGVEIKQRGFAVTQRVIAESGEVFALGALRSPSLDRVQAAHQQFYRPKDSGVGGINSGLAVHLDIFFRVYLPIVYGQIQVNPFDWTDMTEMQKRRLHRVPEEEDRVLSQIIDVVDVGATMGNFEGFAQPTGDAARYFSMAAFHNQAAAAICTSAFDLRGAVMAALLCAELATKALVLAGGKPESQLQQDIGHNLLKARGDLEGHRGLEVGTFLALAEGLPHFVKSRYESRDWTRRECAEIVLDAQRMLAMAARFFAENSFSNMLVSQ